MRITKAILLLGLVTITSQVWSQKTLEGCFKEEIGIAADEWNSFIFYKDQSFFFQKISDFGDYHGYGTYELSYDSLTLTFHEVPVELQQNRVIEGPPRSRGGTLIQARDGLNPHEKVNVSYSLIQGDSLVKRGGSDVFGNIYLDSGMTNVKLTLTGFSPNTSSSVNFYGAQHLELEHTSARSIILMFIYKPTNVHFIEGGQVVKLKSRVLQNGARLKVFPKSGNFFHPSPGTTSYSRSE